MKKIAELWEKIESNIIKCNVCSHYCTIPEGKKGICKTRKNINGTLYVLSYGSLSSTGSNDPIEKKPLYHFIPGSYAFSIATIGCNFRCKNCQNWNISQSFPDDNGDCALFSKDDQKLIRGSSFPLSYYSPEETIKRAKKSRCDSIAYTYNEPTISFEYVRDCAILAKKEGIKNVLVTNGYSSPEANEEYIKFIDAANIDVKSFDDDFYKKIVGAASVEPVKKTAEFFKKNGMHVEITNLIIPDANDNIDHIRSLCQWVFNKLGPDTPLHFSAYFPRYKLQHESTSLDILEKAYEIAKKEGLYYVYLGNIRGKRGNNTKCFKCGAILIKRQGYFIEIKNLKNQNLCRKCGQKNFII